MTTRLATLGAVVASAVVLAGCGDDATTPPAAQVTTVATTTSARAPRGKLVGDLIRPPVPAPALVLRDPDGRVVDLREFRGRPVFITFVYVNCPDVCPLIVQTLRRMTRLAPGARPAVLAVSVDPRGDTPAAVRAFLKRQRAEGIVTYAIGSRAELRPVWQRWDILARAAKEDPHFIEHAAPVYGVGASGTLRTIYPTNVDARTLATDARLLAAR